MNKSVYSRINELELYQRLSQTLRYALLFSLAVSFIVLFIYKSAIAIDESEPASVKVAVALSGDSLGSIEIFPDSLDVSIVIPAPPVSVAPPQPPEPAGFPERVRRGSYTEDAPVFIKTVLENGELRSWDSSGKVWEYDHVDGVYTLRWRDGHPHSTESHRIYVSGYDTVVVSRDRDEEWATRRQRFPVYHDESINVRENVFVRGKIVCNERVRISGLVEGDVRSLEEIIITETGVLDGDAHAPSIRIYDGGLITGREDESSQSPFMPEDGDRYFRELVDFGAIPIFIAITGALLLVAFISISVSSKALSRTSETIARYPLKSFWTGLAGIPVYIIAISVVGVTVVGIPLALLMIVAFPWALLVGIVSHTQYVGGLALSSYGRGPSVASAPNGASVKQILIGSVILMSIWTAAIALYDSRSEFLAGWGVFLLVFAIVFSAICTISGFGAIALTRFGRREYTPGSSKESGKEPPAPTPPPIPGSPNPTQPAAPTPPDLPSSADDVSQKETESHIKQQSASVKPAQPAQPERPAPPSPPDIDGIG